MSKLISILLLLLSISCSQNIDHNSEFISSDDYDLINYLFEDISDQSPGASFAVIKNGKIVNQNSFGLANVAEKIKSTVETNYRIASVAKQFTAMGIMILEDQGKLSFDNKLTEIFDDFPDYGDSINIRHLLTHQSGVIDYEEFILEDRTEQMLDIEVLNGLIKLDSTYFAPGTQYQYSNSGYALLALVIEKISGQSFANFMMVEIFEKLNMSNTKVFELNVPITKRAYGYSIKNDSIKLNDQSLTSTIQGDGGIYSNVLDYYKWDQALYTDILIPLEKTKEAFYDYDNNKKTRKEGYGFGWAIKYVNDIKVLDHLGGTVGFGSWVKRIPSLNLTVVIFENQDGQDRLLMNRINGLTSIYSNYKIPMPLEVLMKKGIDHEGIQKGIEIFETEKGNSKYFYDNTTLTFLGFDYYRIKKYETAKLLFNKAIQEFPNHFGGYYSLGLLNKKLENWNDAKFYFTKVIELGSDDEPWMIDRARKYLNEIIERDKNCEL